MQGQAGNVKELGSSPDRFSIEPLAFFLNPSYLCGMKSLFATVLVLAGTAMAAAQVHTESIEYKQADAILEGHLAYDASIKGKRPAVLIVHQWKGLTDYEKKRA